MHSNHNGSATPAAPPASPKSSRYGTIIRYAKTSSRDAARAPNSRLTGRQCALPLLH